MNSQLNKQKTKSDFKKQAGGLKDILQAVKITVNGCQLKVDSQIAMINDILVEAFKKQSNLTKNGTVQDQNKLQRLQQLEDENQIIKSSMGNFSSLPQQIHSLKQENETLKYQLQSLQVSLTCSEKIVYHLQSQDQLNKKQYDQLMQTVTLLQAEADQQQVESILILQLTEQQCLKESEANANELSKLNQKFNELKKVVDQKSSYIVLESQNQHEAQIQNQQMIIHDLQTQVDYFNQILLNTQQQENVKFDEFKTQIDTKTAENKSLNQQITKIKQEFEDYKKSKEHSYNEKQNQLQQQTKQLEKEKEQFLHQMQEIRKQSEINKTEAKNATEKIQQLQAELKTKSADLLTKTAMTQQLSQEVKRIKQELSTAVEQLNNVRNVQSSQIDDQKIKKMQEELAEVKKTNDILTNSCKDHTQITYSLEMQIKEHANLQEEQLQTISKLDNKIKSLEQQLLFLQQQISQQSQDTGAKQQQLNQELRLKEQEITQVQTQLDAKSSQIVDLSNTLTQLKSDYDKLDQQSKKQQAMLLNKQQAISMQSELLQQDLDKYKSLYAEKSVSKQSQRDVSQNLSVTKSELQKAEEKILKYQYELEYAESQLKVQQKQFENDLKRAEQLFEERVQQYKDHINNSSSLVKDLQEKLEKEHKKGSYVQLNPQSFNSILLNTDKLKQFQMGKTKLVPLKPKNE
ncbi:Hypothetical_protein [Hexamita inflata]|uniref:Hypothetical_protein n=1 Tax=Hexamita inflata TaxID=28002 RepID=A0AA86NWE9_9EUKA|nr:Hypothetical protein HINF_LOCUS15085 [Hexamita inflata]